MTKRVLTAGLAAVALAGFGCGGDDSGSGGDDSGSGGGAYGGAAGGATTQEETKLAGDRGPAPPGVTIKSAASQFGKVLFSKGDRAIYYFDKESTSKPECYGACARAWPPVLTKGRPQAAGRVRQGLLGARKRSNGKRQVTYDGHPLYFYVDDPRGEVLCHNIEEFGGLWLAVKPSGGTPPV